MISDINHKPPFLSKYLFRQSSFLLTEIDEKNNYLAILTKRLNITLSHNLKLVKELDKRHIITKQSIGRRKIIKLTRKGKEIRNHIFQIKEQFYDMERGIENQEICIHENM